MAAFLAKQIFTCSSESAARVVNCSRLRVVSLAALARCCGFECLSKNGVKVFFEMPGWVERRLKLAISVTNCHKGEGGNTTLSGLP